MKSKTVFCCSECGYETAKWLGKCPSCGEWNTIKEVTALTKESRKAGHHAYINSEPMHLSEIGTDSRERMTTGISELDAFWAAACDGISRIGRRRPGIGKPRF